MYSDSSFVSSDAQITVTRWPFFTNPIAVSLIYEAIPPPLKVGTYSLLTKTICIYLNFKNNIRDNLLGNIPKIKMGKNDFTVPPKTIALYAIFIALCPCPISI